MVLNQYSLRPYRAGVISVWTNAPVPGVFPLVHKKGRLRRRDNHIYHYGDLFNIDQPSQYFGLRADTCASSTLPLLQVVQLIEIADVFERIDVLFVLILFLGLGAKMTAFFYGCRNRPH